MPLYDFTCSACHYEFEAIVPSSEETTKCREGTCEGTAGRHTPATHSFSLIQATHLKSKKLKAGHVHTHGDRPKTPGKIQVGWNGD